MVNIERLCPGCMNDNGGQRVCPICGYDAAVQNPSEYLPVKFHLTERYVIGQAKKENGEGVTYLGWDSARDIAVTIREYFPVPLAIRNPDCTVSSLPNVRYVFNEGLMQFIEVNRRIKEIAPPAVSSLLDVFELNGTVYAVEQHIASISLKEFLEKNGGTLKWEQARPLFLPLIDTVKMMNEEGFVHGGISPETILAGRDGKLRLSGYGIKKLRVFNEEIQSELFPGFAALEQYGTEKTPDSRTDVYGLSAVLFRVLIGIVPPSSTERAAGDAMSVPAKYVEELPRHVLHALANGLQIDSAKRTPNMDVFKNELVYAETADKKMPVKAPSQTENPSVIAPHQKKKESGVKYVAISALCTAAVFLVIIGILSLTVFRDSIFGKKSSESEVSSSAPVSSEESSHPVSVPEVTGNVYPVPDITGKYYASLKDEESLEKFEVKIKGKEYSDKYERGQICAQSVPAGTSAAYKTVIEITISLGSKETKMPSLSGKDLENARIDLLKLGFLYDNIEIVIKDEKGKTPGTVIDQKPASGTKISTDESVTIFIACYEVPKVEGLTEEKAKIELSKYGFLYHNIEVKEENDPRKNPGVVISQNPASGTKLDDNTDPSKQKITITINSYGGDTGEEDEE